MINKNLKNHIETNIFPEYEKDNGHGLDHIKSVIKYSLEFAEQIPDINYDMVYIIAAYHDLGRKIDNDTHEKISAQMLLADDALRQFFSDEELKIMAEAVEDHRASLDSEPRSIYGKIVSSADRTIPADVIILRSVDYHKSLYPDISLDENIRDAAKHLIKKFGKNGYGVKKMYFNQDNYRKVCEEVTEIALDFDKFKNRYLSLKGEINE